MRNYVIYNIVMDQYACSRGMGRNTTAAWTNDLDVAIRLTGADLDYIQACMDSGHFLPDPEMTLEWRESLGAVVGMLFRSAREHFKRDHTLESYEGIWYMEIVDDVVVHQGYNGQFTLEKFRERVIEGIHSDITQSKILLDHEIDEAKKKHEEELEEIRAEWEANIDRQYGEHLKDEFI